MKIKKHYKILSIHSRKQHNFEQAVALYQLYGEHFAHITTFFFGKKTVEFINRISSRIATIMAKRSIDGLPGESVINFPITEIKRKLAPVLKYYYSPYMADRAFQQEIINNISPPEVCISFDALSYLLFKAWKGRTKLYLDLTIAIPQYYLVFQHGKNYNPGMLHDTDEFHRRIYKNAFDEIELADIILCGSEFVKQSVLFFKPEYEHKCRILPYASHSGFFNFPTRVFEPKINLKFVSVGTVEKRKGSDILVNAWKIFHQQHPECELHFFGAVHHADFDTGLTSENVFFHGRVAKSSLAAQLMQMDVFVLPTLHEGSSIAIYEAMSMQLPVITTLNSGTVLKHSKSCEMITPGEIDELISAMDKLFYDAEYRKLIAENAYILSKEYSWDSYKYRLSKILNEEGCVNIA